MQRVLLEKLRAKHTRMAGWLLPVGLSYRQHGWAYWVWWAAMAMSGVGMYGWMSGL